MEDPFIKFGMALGWVVAGIIPLLLLAFPTLTRQAEKAGRPLGVVLLAALVAYGAVLAICTWLISAPRLIATIVAVLAAWFAGSALIYPGSPSNLENEPKQ
jgi:hypothetical protein